ncbi:MAG: hypothetical protein AVDCRST_MAG96-2665, partial [uncultured Segetibacter sp.]
FTRIIPAKENKQLKYKRFINYLYFVLKAKFI